MTPRAFRLLLIGLICIEIMVFVLDASVGLNKLSIKSQRLVDTKLKSQTADAQIASLSQAKTQVEKYAYFNEVAKTVIPNDKDQAQAVLDIFSIANDAGIAIGSVTFPASTLGGSSSSASATGSGATSAAISQAKPVSGIKGLYSLELTVVPQIGPLVPAAKMSTYPKFLDFMKRIERDRRTAQISEVTVQPQPGSQELGFSLKINIFIRPAK